MAEFQSFTKRAKGLGSAKSGVNSWIAQRVSSILMVPFGLVVIFWLTANHRLPYKEMLATVGNPWGACVVFIFVASASYHASLGLQTMVDDYFHTPFLRYWGLLKARLTGYILPIIILFLLIQIMLMGHQ
jgi:succinate dehydrogenase / fumarate reductase, membrane anchor subunit